MKANYEKFLKTGGRPGGVRASVRYKNNTRYNKAVEQIQEAKDVNVAKIIKFTNDFLEGMGMTKVEEPKLSLVLDDEEDFNLRVRRKEDNLPISKIYNEMRQNFNLNDKRDIVWMKFTDDGYLGVVAVSNDINFSIPTSSDDYNKSTGGKWTYNTSGILLHKLGKKWDRSFVLVFPLCNIPSGYKRGDIECGIGNYLIDNDVPIIDFYSHRF